MTDSPDGQLAIGEALAKASAYLAAHPDEARYTDSVAVASLDEGLRVSVEGPAQEHVTTDMPSSVGGGGSMPSPGWLLRAAIASCVATVAAMRAAQLGLSADGLRVEVDSESDDRGILGVDESVPAGPLSVRIGISMPSLEHAQLNDVAAWAVRHCPVSEMLGREVPIRLDLAEVVT